MTIEDELKALVLSSYGSIREFSLALNMPYSTLDSIFKRGVEKASIGNIIRICEALSISVDGLAAGKIVSVYSDEATSTEGELIRLYRSLNEKGKEIVLTTVRAFAGNPELRRNPNEEASAMYDHVNRLIKDALPDGKASEDA